jgi:hypothetical protein
MHAILMGMRLTSMVTLIHASGLLTEMRRRQLRVQSLGMSREILVATGESATSKSDLMLRADIES